MGQNRYYYPERGEVFMDLVKIGSYIAEKRKKLGMTQKQLAEKLGKSDKSVSKWERGVSQTKRY
nr:helix-turn-helix transcriptional regulator [[Ruminococcus] lactaris]